MAHSECFSMCCHKAGHCIETKYCYNDLHKAFSETISDVSNDRLRPATNSSTNPLISNSDLKPCFSYAQYNNTATDRYQIDANIEYTEPEVFAQDGAILTLTNYTFAYGNDLSDSIDNPFKIDVLDKGSLKADLSAQDPNADSTKAMIGMIASNENGKKVEKIEDPYETSKYRTQVDKVGHYSYYTQGHYSAYSSYEYRGHSLIIEFDAQKGQKCTYENYYQAWSQYGLDSYECTRELNMFDYQENTFKTIGLIFGLVFVAFSMIVGLFLHVLKVKLYGKQNYQVAVTKQMPIKSSLKKPRIGGENNTSMMM